MTISIKLSYKAILIIAMAQAATNSIHAAGDDDDAESVAGSVVESVPGSIAFVPIMDSVDLWDFVKTDKNVSELYMPAVDSVNLNQDKISDPRIEVKRWEEIYADFKITDENKKEFKKLLNGFILPAWLAGSSLSYDEHASILYAYSQPNSTSAFRCLTPFSFSTAGSDVKQMGLFNQHTNTVYVQDLDKIYYLNPMAVAIGLYATLYPKKIDGDTDIDALSGLEKLAYYKKTGSITSIASITLNTEAKDSNGDYILDPNDKRKTQFKAIAYSFEPVDSDPVTLYFEAKTCSYLEPDIADLAAHSKDFPIYKCSSNHVHYKIGGKSVKLTERSSTKQEQIGLVINLIMRYWGKNIGDLRSAFMQTILEQYDHNNDAQLEWSKLTSYYTNINQALAKYSESENLWELVARLYTALNPSENPEEPSLRGAASGSAPSAPSTATLPDRRIPESSPTSDGNSPFVKVEAQTLLMPEESEGPATEVAKAEPEEAEEAEEAAE